MNWQVAAGVVMCAAAALAAEPANVLRNPNFGFHPRLETGRPGGARSHNVACWNSDAWGDITVVGRASLDVFHPVVPDVNAVRIAPGKRLYQFAALPELGCKPGDQLSLAVRGFTGGGGKLRACITVMRIESGDGTWAPKDFGCNENRTFSCHARGELVRGTTVAKTVDMGGAVTIDLAGLTLETVFKRDRKASSSYTNPVGLLVEFSNVGSAGDVWVYGPTLTVAPTAPALFTSGRSVPEYYRRMPVTIGKLMRGEPIHVLCLGSSIDTGSANPRLYIYDEDPESATYKQPLWQGKFDAAKTGRPDLTDYIHYPQQYVKYTGRLQRELLRKFNLRVSDIFLNAMSCGGSSIGESHSGFEQYTVLEWAPGSANGHPKGKSWEELYPGLFKNGAKPSPDLVILGHGHNERIDKPDGIAVYEGAIRWFQKRFPQVEFLFCQWHTSPTAGNNIPPIPVRRELCRHYGIPFIDVSPMVEELTRTWCNYYALCPDGGHPQAGTHYLWFRQIEQAFEMAGPLKPFLPQHHLPKRFNPYTYGWEGDLVTLKAPHPRIKGTRLIVEDTAFNLWCGDGTKERMTITIDGKPGKRDAGNGRQMTARNGRNSSFVHGRLRLGDRHLIEISGKKQVVIHAADLKVCDKRTFFPVAHAAWRPGAGGSEPVVFKSSWGAPYGDRVLALAPGREMVIEVEATDVSIAYVDAEDGGTLVVAIDGKPCLSQATDVPFTDTGGTTHFIENRRGIRALGWGTHLVMITAGDAPVRLLGLYTYDARP